MAHTHGNDQRVEQKGEIYSFFHSFSNGEFFKFLLFGFYRGDATM